MPRHRTLSKAARRAIITSIKAGDYKERVGRLEPPYMAPSPDPNDYPWVCYRIQTFHTYSSPAKQWCSLCNDFGGQLVLCNGCRVAICVKSRNTLVGCLEWDAIINDEDFIFFCPFCTWSAVAPCPVCGRMLIQWCLCVADFSCSFDCLTRRASVKSGMYCSGMIPLY